MKQFYIQTKQQNTHLLLLVDNILQARSALFWDISRPTVIIHYRRFGTTLISHFSRVKKSKTLEDGPLGCPETSVRHNHYTPRNIPEERRPHILQNGSLQSHVFISNTLLSSAEHKNVKNSAQKLLIYGRIFIWTSRVLNLLQPTLLPACTHIPVVATTSFGRRIVTGRTELCTLDICYGYNIHWLIPVGKTPVITFFCIMYKSGLLDEDRRTDLCRRSLKWI